MVRVCLLLVLTACGGAPSPSAVRLELIHAAGGAYRGGCLSGALLYAARADRLERWRLTEGPALEAVLPTAELASAPPMTAVGCEGARVVAHHGDRVAVGLEGDEVTWRGRPDAARGWPTAAPLDAWRRPLPDGRVLVLDALGLGLARGDRYDFWRPAAGRLAAALWDGELVWAVGVNGLWRWRPGPGAPIPIPLPRAIAGTPLTGIFRDGPFIWVVDADGRGRPLDVSGPEARAVGEAGDLRPAPDVLRTQVNGVAVAAHPTLRIGEVVLPTEGPVTALLPMADVLYAADGAGVRRWQVTADGRAILQARSALPGPTIALFATGPDTMVWVGADYGFVQVRITRSSATPRSPRPAP